MRLAFVCSGRPDNLKYLTNNRNMVDELLTKHGWKVIQTPLFNISDLNKRLKEYQGSNVDEFLFFYTGHGDVSNRQQILKLQLENTEISMNDVLDSIFKYINPKKQAIVLDACYSGTLKDLALEKDTEFLFSSQAREQSYEDDKLKASVFSFYFCEAVTHGHVKLEEISKYIDSSNNKQKPLTLSIGSEFIEINQKNIDLESLLISKVERTSIQNFFDTINYTIVKNLIIIIALSIIVFSFFENNSNIDLFGLKNRFLPLDGYEVIKKDGVNIFNSGVKIDLTLFHNMKGKKSILIREINLNIIKYDENFFFTSKIDESKIGGAGTINPRVFTSVVFGSGKVKNKNKNKIYYGKNILDNQLLKLSISDDIEKIYWQILVLKEGLYTLNYDIIYSIGNKDNIFISNNFKVAL